MKKTKALSEVDVRSRRIVRVGTDLFRVRLKRRDLLEWFARVGDVTVTEDGRIFFPGWMLPAVRSLFRHRAGRSGHKSIQLDLWGEE